MTNLNAIINEINEINNYDQLITKAEVLFDDVDLDDTILKAIEKRQNELYTETGKDIAEKELRAGIKKQQENTRKNKKSAIIKQSRINKNLLATYNNL